MSFFSFHWMSWGLFWTVLEFLVLAYTATITLKYRELRNQFVDVIEAIKAATGSDSPGGKRVTNKEMAEIIKEIVDVALEALKIWFKFPIRSVFRKAPRIVNKLRGIKAIHI